MLSRLSDSTHKAGEVHIFKQRIYISALEQARVLILGKHVLLLVINTIYKQSHLSDFWQMQVKNQFFGSWALYISFGTGYEVNIM